LILGGRSSSEDDKMIVGMARSLVKIGGEKGLKNALKLKFGRVNVNFFDENRKS
jgi:hypothetical protein